MFISNLIKHSGIPLKISISSIFIFILGTAFLIYYVTKNYNEQLDKQINSNAKSIAFVLESAYLSGTDKTFKKISPALQRLLNADEYLRKVAVIALPKNFYIYSTHSDEINRPVSEDLLQLLQKGGANAFSKDLIAYKNTDSRMITAVQFSGKIISPDEAVNPVGYVQILYDWGKINRNKQNFFNMILLSSFFVILVCFLMMFFLLGKVSVCIQKINLIIDGLTRNIFQFKPEKRNDELGLTGLALEKLKNGLKETQKELFELRKNKNAQTTSETVEKSSHIFLERQTVVAKIEVESFHQLYSEKLKDELMDMIVQVYEFLDAHFLNFGGKIIQYNGAQALVVFSKSQTEKTAVESIHELRRKIQIFSPNVPKIQRREFRLKAAVHKGNLLHSEIFAFGKTYSVFTGNAYQEIQKLFELAGKEEILLSSSIAKEIKISFDLIAHAQNFLAENEPDSEIFMLPQELQNPVHKPKTEVVSQKIKFPEETVAKQEVSKIKENGPKKAVEQDSSPDQKTGEQKEQSIFSMVEETFQTKTYK